MRRDQGQLYRAGSEDVIFQGVAVRQRRRPAGKRGGHQVRSGRGGTPGNNFNTRWLI